MTYRPRQQKPPPTSLKDSGIIVLQSWAFIAHHPEDWHTLEFEVQQTAGAGAVQRRYFFTYVCMYEVPMPYIWKRDADCGWMSGTYLAMHLHEWKLEKGKGQQQHSDTTAHDYYYWPEAWLRLPSSPCVQTYVCMWAVWWVGRWSVGGLCIYSPWHVRGRYLPMHFFLLPTANNRNYHGINRDGLATVIIRARKCVC
jgi:hypothetical protein